MTQPKRIYSPKAAWLRASLYFGACLLVACFSGALDWALTAPLASAEQRAQPLWWLLTAACWLVIVVGYGVVWPRGTFTDGRPQHALLSLAYGAVWGACQAPWFLTIWLLVARSGLAAVWVAAISYLLIGGYNGIWHRFFWDIYVSPPHNYTEWNAKKVLLCHTPNLLLTLTMLALYGNAGMFVLLQAVALALSAFAMHFPAPWDDYRAEAGLEKPIAAKTA